MNKTKIGFYEALLTVDNIVEKVTLGLTYYGLEFNIDVGGYTRTADYYLLLELTNEDISNYSAPDDCSVI